MTSFTSCRKTATVDNLSVSYTVTLCSPYQEISNEHIAISNSRNELEMTILLVILLICMLFHELASSK